MTFHSGFSHWKLWFTTVMLNYQKVTVGHWEFRTCKHEKLEKLKRYYHEKWGIQRFNYEPQGCEVCNLPTKIWTYGLKSLLFMEPITCDDKTILFGGLSFWPKSKRAECGEAILRAQLGLILDSKQFPNGSSLGPGFHEFSGRPRICWVKPDNQQRITINTT